MEGPNATGNLLTSKLPCSISGKRRTILKSALSLALDLATPNSTTDRKSKWSDRHSERHTRHSENKKTDPITKVLRPTRQQLNTPTMLPSPPMSYEDLPAKFRIRRTTINPRMMNLSWRTDCITLRTLAVVQGARLPVRPDR